MHTVFEGIAKCHLNLLLHHLIDSVEAFSLSDLNHCLLSRLYEYSQSDTQPTPTTRESSTSDFRIAESGKIYNQLSLYQFHCSFTNDDFNYSTSTIHTW